MSRTEAAGFVAAPAAGGGQRRRRASKRPLCFESVAHAVKDLTGEKVASEEDVTAGPGVLNQHLKVVTAGGERFFVKLNRNFPADVFAAEDASLSELRTSAEFLVPKPYRVGTLSGGGSFSVLEWLELVPFGSAISSVQTQLGHQLGLLHRDSVREGAAGFRTDTWLGSTRQDNSWCGDFADFFVSQRLRPMMNAVRRRFGEGQYGTSNETALAFSERNAEFALVAASRRLREVEIAPTLLHGDLWMGNTAADRKRRPVVFDPASWYGHDEFDLAVNMLFGKFSPDFYSAYHAIVPRRPGFERRNEVYRLYHYLNHLKLFGPGQAFRGTVDNPGGYYERAAEIVQNLVSERVYSS